MGRAKSRRRKLPALRQTPCNLWMTTIYGYRVASLIQLLRASETHVSDTLHTVPGGAWIAFGINHGGMTRRTISAQMSSDTQV